MCEPHEDLTRNQFIEVLTLNVTGDDEKSNELLDEYLYFINEPFGHESYDWCADIACELPSYFGEDGNIYIEGLNQ